jgi:hypothetical protein
MWEQPYKAARLGVDPDLQDDYLSQRICVENYAVPMTPRTLEHHSDPLFFDKREDRSSLIIQLFP